MFAMCIVAVLKGFHQFVLFEVNVKVHWKWPKFMNTLRLCFRRPRPTVVSMSILRSLYNVSQSAHALLSMWCSIEKLKDNPMWNCSYVIFSWRAWRACGLFELSRPVQGEIKVYWLLVCGVRCHDLRPAGRSWPHIGQISSGIVWRTWFGMTMMKKRPFVERGM